MASKERNQNPVVGDTVRLKFFTFNNGNYADPTQIESVKIYKLLSTDVTEVNPTGRLLIMTVDGNDVVRDEEGKYHIDLELEQPRFTQGKFQDEWNIVFEEDTPIAKSNMDFRIAPTIWFTDSMPIVHDFSFDVRPNRVKHGSKKYLQIRVIPDVPRGTDKQRYYENMATAGEIYISIEQKCGNCLPAEQDLRLLIDKELVTERDGCVAYYELDTREMDCGIYDITIEVHLGPNIFVSDPHPMQIF